MSAMREYFNAVSKLNVGDKQKAFFNYLNDNLNIVRISLLSELPNEISQSIIDMSHLLDIQQKQCYENCVKLAIGLKCDFVDVNYVEGYTTCCGLVIEHAFLKIKTKDGEWYVDPTIEMCTDVEKNVIKENEYYPVYHFSTKELFEKIETETYYGNWWQQIIFGYSH